jgi:predicted metal-dependent phosphotriesterase family hydrolase
MRPTPSSDPYVETVLGPIAPDALGPTVTHEHLFSDLRSPETDDAAIRQEYSDVMLNNAEQALVEMGSVYAAGGRTIVEVTTANMGRRADQLREISSASGVQIVCATGFYVREWHSARVTEASVDELAAQMIGELNVGIAETGIRAGVIKIASSSSPLEGSELTCFRAAARAELATGVALTTHNPSTAEDVRRPTPGMGMEQLDLFEEEGVAPSRVILGHCDLNPDLDLHLALARRGAYVQYDHVGGDRFCTDRRRAELVLGFFAAGLGDHLVLAHDFGREKYFRSRGGPGYDATLRDFVPLLRQVGLGDHEIHTLLVENPRRVLPRHGPRPLAQGG